MKNRDLNTQRETITRLFKNTQIATIEDIELQSHWAKYLCVLCAGYIENSISLLYSDFAKTAASEPILRYVQTTLSQIRNPKSQKFLETARAFKIQWADELEVFISDNGRKEAIDSIMTNRHRIAHGKNSSISIATLKPWFEKANEVIQFIENQCN